MLHLFFTSAFSGTSGPIDGFYGSIPVSWPRERSSVWIRGTSVVWNAEGVPEHGSIELGPDRFTLRGASGAFVYTYAVRDGILVVGVPVRRGKGWIAHSGSPSGAPCNAWDANSWEGCDRWEVLPEKPVGVPMGPVGVHPSGRPPPQGRWWAEGQPGLRSDASGTVAMWKPECTGDISRCDAFFLPQSSDSTDRVFSVRPLIAGHGWGVSHGDTPGWQLSFLTTEGNLFWFEIQTSCGLAPPPRWAIYEEVHPSR